MVMRAVTRFVLFIVVVMLSGCTAVPSGNFSEASTQQTGRELTVWMLSDIQPPTVQQRYAFEAAVEDVSQNIGPIDIGIMAGDLLTSRSKDEAFTWFIETRGKADVTDWYQIAGNHDVRSGPIFYSHFPQPEYFAVELGNLLFLFMSDQSTASRTDLSDEAFVWWKEMVENNQDRNIITVTHAQLRGSGLISSSISSRVIHNSERFEKVLQEEKVVLWVSGHSHLPHSLSGTVRTQKKFRGTYFVNVSSISDESLLDSESRFFYLRDGADVMWMRSRNHTTGTFNNNLDIPITLKTPFRWSGERPKLL